MSSAGARSRTSPRFSLLEGAVTGLGIPSGDGVIVQRIPAPSRCGGPHTNYVSTAPASHTHCCAPKRATDSYAGPVKPLTGRLRLGRRGSNPRPTDNEPLGNASATRHNGQLTQTKSLVKQHFARCKYEHGTNAVRLRTALIAGVKYGKRC